MKIRHFSLLLLMIFAVASLVSCGGGGTSGSGGGTSGGGAVFDTVTVTAQSAVSSPFDSDVAKHTDATPGNCGVPGSDSVTVSPDSADFIIQSTVIPGLPSDIIASNVRLDSVTITYTSATSPASPAIPAQNYALSAIIEPGGSVTIPVRIVSQLMKASSPLLGLRCGGGMYSYYVTVTFNGVEVNTNEARSFETNFSINFADFID